MLFDSVAVKLRSINIKIILALSPPKKVIVVIFFDHQGNLNHPPSFIIPLDCCLYACLLGLQILYAWIIWLG